jgi:hypothetical protein
MLSKEEWRYNNELREYLKYIKRINVFFVWYFGELSKKKSIRRRKDFLELSKRVGKDVSDRWKILSSEEFEFVLKFLEKEKDLDRLLSGWDIGVEHFKWIVWEDEDKKISSDEIVKRLSSERNNEILKSLKKKGSSRVYNGDWVKNMSNEDREKYFGGWENFSLKRRNDKVKGFWKILCKVEKEVCYRGLDLYKILGCKRSLNEKGLLSINQFNWFLFRLYEMRLTVDFLRKGKITKKMIREEYEWILKYKE